MPELSLPDLCRDLADLYAGLEAGLSRDRRPGEGRRGVPKSRPPLDDDALQASEALEKAAPVLWRECREALGFNPPSAVGPDGLRRWTPLAGLTAVAALAALPVLVAALPDDDPLAGRVRGTLAGLRQRARDVLGLSRPVLWLDDCPTTYPAETDVEVPTRDGVLVEAVLGCWTWDLAALAEAPAGTEVWRRSRLVLPLEEAVPRVRCWSCGFEADPRRDFEWADVVAAHLAEKGVVPT